ncbi:MAG: rod shape-determining protein MreC [Chloroflexota bacterium]|nr:rod shape-determining protein MreC [Chloroflexota bacterium]
MNGGLGYRRNWRANRGLFLFVTLIACAGLIIASRAGLLAPVEDALSTPINAVSGVFNRIALGINSSAGDLAQIQALQRRNSELEEALAQFQAELVELREIASDYQRLSDLLDYTATIENMQFVTGDVIAIDQNAIFRSITINRGTRDGIGIGMPVVTRQGLVGRVLQVSAGAARVMLVTETTGNVSGRLQTTRAEGSVRGAPNGNLIMGMIPLDSEVREGDLVVTSGLGGNFPPDIVIGQVTSARQAENGLSQEAQVRSLINFDTLEFVLVVSNFQPIDLSVFDQATGN